MDAWRKFLDYCRTPALPYQKVRARPPWIGRPSCSRRRRRRLAAASPPPCRLPLWTTSNRLESRKAGLCLCTQLEWQHASAPDLHPHPQFGESSDIEGGRKKFWAALCAEFLGMLLFALYGGEARDQAAGRCGWGGEGSGGVCPCPRRACACQPHRTLSPAHRCAAYGNGLALAVLVYATAHVSGGHLNPAVTLGTMLSGHMAPRTGLAYMAAQVLGGIVGARRGRWLDGYRRLRPAADAEPQRAFVCLPASGACRRSPAQHPPARCHPRRLCCRHPPRQAWDSRWR